MCLGGVAWQECAKNSISGTDIQKSPISKGWNPRAHQSHSPALHGTLLCRTTAKFNWTSDHWWKTDHPLCAPIKRIDPLTFDKRTVTLPFFPCDSSPFFSVAVPSIRGDKRRTRREDSSTLGQCDVLPTTMWTFCREVGSSDWTYKWHFVRIFMRFCNTNSKSKRNHEEMRFSIAFYPRITELVIIASLSFLISQLLTSQRCSTSEMIL